jgi:uncharacterized short protein YbdD (DUF466 family)
MWKKLFNFKLFPEFSQLLSAEKRYQKYLEHFYREHPDQTPLSKRKFFSQKEQEKWNGINRCC